MQAKQSGIALWALGGLLCLSPHSAHAWGLSTELKESWAEARLVFPVLKENRIRYCLQNEAPAEFNGESIAHQVEAALNLWLAPLREIGIQGVEIQRVSCASPDFHLRVEIGPESTWMNLGSYQLSSWEGPHYYSLVKFDTGFLSTVDGASYPIVDFLRYAPDLRAEKELIRQASVVQRETVPSFAAHHGLDQNAVFWSTYPSLLHELGHSFGLCDTYDAPIKDQCDPAFSSAAQPPSVMKDSNYFYLTPDDVTAIRRLFQRFR